MQVGIFFFHTPIPSLRNCINKKVGNWKNYAQNCCVSFKSWYKSGGCWYNSGGLSFLLIRFLKEEIRELFTCTNLALVCRVCKMQNADISYMHDSFFKKSGKILLISLQLKKSSILVPIKKGWFFKGDFEVRITVSGDWPKRWTNALERDRRESKYYWKKTIGYMSPCLKVTMTKFFRKCPEIMYAVMFCNYILRIWSILGWKKFLETVKSSLNSFVWLQAVDFCTIKDDSD